MKGNVTVTIAPPRILLADDHELLMAAYERLLWGECDVVGQVTDGHALLAAAERLEPDVIVLDISMPVLNGLEAARQISHTRPGIKLVFLTMHEEADVAAAAFRAGASAYLLKRSAGSELATAIREVMQGRSYITPLMAQGLVGSLLRLNTQAVDLQLTTRQKEVLQLLAEGRSMKEVAGVLNMAPRTVAANKYQLMQHLNVKSTAELIQYAVKHGIV
jgi:DNA-binding NarL/FixJ family response regulator